MRSWLTFSLSGLCIAIQLKRKLGFDNFTIYDKDSSFGGTWFQNTYPGVACDIPAPLYSYSFARNPDWSSEHPPGKEILAYITSVVDRYDLRKHFSFNSEVRSCDWKDVEKQYSIVVRINGVDKRVKANFVISAVGQLHYPHTPKLPGHFNGPTMHTARWDNSYDFVGKNVAVIGNGASAIQTIPELAKIAKELYVFQRTPNWITARSDRKFGTVMKFIFRYVPGAALIWRYLWFLQYEVYWTALSNMSPVLKAIGTVFVWSNCLKYVKDKQLRRKLKPDFKLGCKRTLFSNIYYPALTRDNVKVITDKISTLAEDSVVTTADSYPVDVIIYATGFKTQQFTFPMEIKGKSGVDIADLWKEGPECYKGTLLNRLPNFAFMYGPNVNLGHNSIIFMIEAQADYVIKVLKPILKGDLDSVTPSVAAQKKWNDSLQKDLSKGIWSRSECNSWYQNESGRVVNNWSGFATAFWWEMKWVGWKDLEQVGPRQQRDLLPQVPLSRLFLGALLAGGLYTTARRL